MKFNRSVLIALAAVILILLWFLFHSLSHDKNSQAEPAGAQNTAAERSKAEVVVTTVTAQDHDVTLELYGRTEPNREVSVKAQTAGLIVSTPLQEGTRVKRGALLCRQDTDARDAMVDQAKAQLTTTELEYNATKTLVDKGYRSQTQVASAQAALDGARAALKQAEIERDNVNMRAPFTGVFEKQLAEVGDYLAPGQPCGLLVELDPMLVVAQLTEKQVGSIQVGQTASVTLVTGQTVEGVVRMVDSRANPSTRTFRVEIALPNKNTALKGGVTATISLEAGQRKAHNVPAHVISINDEGIVGVRHLDDNNIVRFAATQTVDEDDTGTWVTGLPETTRLVIKGQDFVAVGTAVEPTALTSANGAAQ